MFEIKALPLLGLILRRRDDSTYVSGIVDLVTGKRLYTSVSHPPATDPHLLAAQDAFLYTHYDGAHELLRVISTPSLVETDFYSRTLDDPATSSATSLTLTQTRASIAPQILLQTRRDGAIQAAQPFHRFYQQQQQQSSAIDRQGQMPTLRWITILPPSFDGTGDKGHLRCDASGSESESVCTQTLRYATRVIRVAPSGHHFDQLGTSYPKGAILLSLVFLAGGSVLFKYLKDQRSTLQQWQ